MTNSPFHEAGTFCFFLIVYVKIIVALLSAPDPMHISPALKKAIGFNRCHGQVNIFKCCIYMKKLENVHSTLTRNDGWLVAADNLEQHASCSCNPIRDIITRIILLWYNLGKSDPGMRHVIYLF